MECNICHRDLPNQSQCPYCTHNTKKSIIIANMKGIGRFLLGTFMFFLFFVGILVIIEGIQTRDIRLFTGPVIVIISVAYFVLRKPRRLSLC